MPDPSDIGAAISAFTGTVAPFVQQEQRLAPQRAALSLRRQIAESEEERKQKFGALRQQLRALLAVQPADRDRELISDVSNKLALSDATPDQRLSNMALEFLQSDELTLEDALFDRGVSVGEAPLLDEPDPTMGGVIAPTTVGVPDRPPESVGIVAGQDITAPAIDIAAPVQPAPTQVPSPLDGQGRTTPDQFRQMILDLSDDPLALSRLSNRDQRLVLDMRDRFSDELATENISPADSAALVNDGPALIDQFQSPDATIRNQALAAYKQLHLRGTGKAFSPSGLAIGDPQEERRGLITNLTASYMRALGPTDARDLGTNALEAVAFAENTADKLLRVAAGERSVERNPILPFDDRARDETVERLEQTTTLPVLQESYRQARRAASDERLPTEQRNAARLRMEEFDRAIYRMTH